MLSPRKATQSLKTEPEIKWVAIETAGTWNQMAVELVQEIGRRITLVTEDSRETVFFQRLSIALQRGNAVSFLSTFTATD